MEAKTHKSGYALLKEKYDMLLSTHKEEMEKGRQLLSEKESIIEKQANKISLLSADLCVAQGNEEEWKHKYNEAIQHDPFWCR